MEQQSISISKAGIVTTLQARYACDQTPPKNTIIGTHARSIRAMGVDVPSLRQRIPFEVAMIRHCPLHRTST